MPGPSRRNASSCARHIQKVYRKNPPQAVCSGETLKASGIKFLKDRHRRQGHASSPGLLAACGTGLASGSLYEVANVSVDTTAKDPVVARALVLAKAGQKALRVVIKRLVPGSAQAMLPAITGCRGHDRPDPV